MELLILLFCTTSVVQDEVVLQEMRFVTTAAYENHDCACSTQLQKSDFCPVPFPYMNRSPPFELETCGMP